MGSLANLVKALERVDTSLQVVFDNGVRQVEQFELAMISASRTAGEIRPGGPAFPDRLRQAGVRDVLQPFRLAGGGLHGEETARRRRVARGLEAPRRVGGGNTRGTLRPNQRTRGEDDIIGAIQALNAGVLAVVGSSSSSYLRATGTVSGGGS